MCLPRCVQWLAAPHEFLECSSGCLLIPKSISQWRVPNPEGYFSSLSGMALSTPTHIYSLLLVSVRAMPSFDLCFSLVPTKCLPFNIFLQKIMDVGKMWHTLRYQHQKIRCHNNWKTLGISSLVGGRQASWSSYLPLVHIMTVPGLFWAGLLGAL